MTGSTKPIFTPILYHNTDIGVKGKKSEQMSVVVLHVTTRCQSNSSDAAAPIPGVINATVTVTLKVCVGEDSLVLLR